MDNAKNFNNNCLKIKKNINKLLINILNKNNIKFFFQSDFDYSVNHITSFIIDFKDSKFIYEQFSNYGLCVSYGSACNCNNTGGSFVIYNYLKNCNIENPHLKLIRFSFGGEINYNFEKIKNIFNFVFN